MHVRVNAAPSSLGFTAAEGMISRYRSQWGKSHPPTPVLSCRLQTLSWRNGGNRDEDGQKEKTPIRLAASVPFSSSGAGNLPRNVTAEH